MVSEEPESTMMFTSLLKWCLSGPSFQGLHEDPSAQGTLRPWPGALDASSGEEGTLKTPRALPPQEHPWEAAGRLWTVPWANAATPPPAPGRLSAGVSIQAGRDGQSGLASFLSTLWCKESSWVRGLWAPQGSSRAGPEQTQGLAGTDAGSLRPQESVALPVPSEDHGHVSTIHTGSGRSFSALEP